MIVVFFPELEIECQRPLRPVGYYDMSMYDAAQLCKALEDDKVNITKAPDVYGMGEIQPFLPDGKTEEDCHFFQWIYCREFFTLSCFK